MNFRTKLFGRLLIRLLLLFFMLFCVYFFYFNAKEQARLFRDYRSTQLSIAEADTLNIIPLSVQYKMAEHEGDMNVNAGLGMSIFLNSILVTAIYFLYILISEIHMAIRSYRQTQRQLNKD